MILGAALSVDEAVNKSGFGRIEIRDFQNGLCYAGAVIYREATRAESRADFAHEIGIVEKEADETRPSPRY